VLYTTRPDLLSSRDEVDLVTALEDASVCMETFEEKLPLLLLRLRGFRGEELKGDSRAVPRSLFRSDSEAGPFCLRC